MAVRSAVPLSRASHLTYSVAGTPRNLGEPASPATPIYSYLNGWPVIIRGRALCDTSGALTESEIEALLVNPPPVRTLWALDTDQVDDNRLRWHITQSVPGTPTPTQSVALTPPVGDNEEIVADESEAEVPAAPLTWEQLVELPELGDWSEQAPEGWTVDDETGYVRFLDENQLTDLTDEQLTQHAVFADVDVSRAEKRSGRAYWQLLREGEAIDAEIRRQRGYSMDPAKFAKSAGPPEEVIMREGPPAAEDFDMRCARLIRQYRMEGLTLNAVQAKLAEVRDAADADGTLPAQYAGIFGVFQFTMGLVGAVWKDLVESAPEVVPTYLENAATTQLVDEVIPAEPEEHVAPTRNEAAEAATIPLPASPEQIHPPIFD